MSEQDAAYLRAFARVEEACRKWKAENPEARPKFRPIALPPLGVGRGGLIAGLDQALELGVAGNSLARRLLTAMDRAAADGGGATVMMAEHALEQVYGIQHALTRQMGN